MGNRPHQPIHLEIPTTLRLVSEIADVGNDGCPSASRAREEAARRVAPNVSPAAWEFSASAYELAYPRSLPIPATIMGPVSKQDQDLSPGGGWGQAESCESAPQGEAYLVSTTVLDAQRTAAVNPSHCSASAAERGLARQAQQRPLIAPSPAVAQVASHISRRRDIRWRPKA